MPFRTFVLLFSLLASGMAVAADYSVSIVQGGIALYRISNTGPELVAGSPFIPSPVPPTMPPNMPPSLTANITPTFVAINPAQNFVYALYQQGNGPATLVGYAVTREGLQQRWERATGIGGTGGHHNPGVSQLEAGVHSATIYVYSPEQSPAETYSAKVFSESGDALATIAGYTASAKDSIFYALVSLQVDSSGAYYYACLQNTTNTSETGAAVYAQKDGRSDRNEPVAGSSAQLLFTSFDATFVNGKCDF